MTKIALVCDSPENVITMDRRLKWSRKEFGQAIFLTAMKNRLIDENFMSDSKNERIDYYKKLYGRLRFNLFKFSEIHKRLQLYDESWIMELLFLLGEDTEVIDCIRGILNNLGIKIF